MPNDVPILLLSGMAADERLFEPQLAEFPSLRVPAWIDPLPDESLRNYAARLAQLVDPRCPCIVGGASFGGMVALEMATHLSAKGCFLISSVRSPDELPWQVKSLRLITLLGPQGLKVTAALAARLVAPSCRQGTVRRLRRLSQPTSAFVRWAYCALLRWRPSPATQRVPVFQIHGEVDRTLPAYRTRANVVVSGAGHLLPRTHPAAVNDCLRRSIDRWHPPGTVS